MLVSQHLCESKGINMEERKKGEEGKKEKGKKEGRKTPLWIQKYSVC